MIVVLKSVTPVKQCMREDMLMEVETVNMDEDEQTTVTSEQRFLPLKVGAYSSFTRSHLRFLFTSLTYT